MDNKQSITCPFCGGKIKEDPDKSIWDDSGTFFLEYFCQNSQTCGTALTQKVFDKYGR